MRSNGGRYLRQPQPGKLATAALRRSGDGLSNVVQAPQPLGDDVAKPLELILVADSTGIDAKRQHRIPWIETVDSHGNSALRAAIDLAQILVDHHRQLLRCYHFFCWIRSRQAAVFPRVRDDRNVSWNAFRTVGPHR